MASDIGLYDIEWEKEEVKVEMEHTLEITKYIEDGTKVGHVKCSVHLKDNENMVQTDVEGVWLEQIGKHHATINVISSKAKDKEEEKQNKCTSSGQDKKTIQKPSTQISLHKRVIHLV